MVHIKKKKILKKKSYLFYFWLCWVFIAEQGLSLVVTSGHSSLRCMGFSLRWLLLLWSPGSRWAVSVVVAHELCCPARHLPCLGIKIVSPALAGGFFFFFFLAGGFLSTVPPGNSKKKS